MSALYPKAKEAFLSGTIALTSDTIKAALLNATDEPYTSTDQYKSAVASYGASTDVTLSAGKSVTNGVFDANDVTFSAVAVDSGKAANALVIYKDTGSAATSPLIAYIDGFTVTPNGGDITVSWDSGASKIFAL